MRQVLVMAAAADLVLDQEMLELFGFEHELAGNDEANIVDLVHAPGPRSNICPGSICFLRIRCVESLHAALVSALMDLRCTPLQPSARRQMSFGAKIACPMGKIGRPSRQTERRTGNIGSL